METIVFKPRLSAIWWACDLLELLLPILWVISAAISAELDFRIGFSIIAAFSIVISLFTQKDKFLKQVTVSEDIILEYWLHKTVRLPLTVGVDIGKNIVAFGRTAIDLRYYRNSRELVDSLQRLIAEGKLAQIAQKPKTTKRKARIERFTLVWAIASVVSVVLNYIFYSSIPFHIVGMMTDSILLFLLLMGINFLVAYLLLRSEPSRTDT